MKHIAKQLQGNVAGVNGPCHGFRGGVDAHRKHVIPNPRIVVIYWDSYFSSNVNLIPDPVTEMNSLIADLVTGKYMHGLMQYGIGSGTLVIPSIIIDMNSNPAPASLTQAQLQQNLITWLNNGTVTPVPAYDETDLAYLILAPTTTKLTLGDTTGFCGYHAHGKFNKNSGNDNLFWAVVQGYTPSFNLRSFVNSIAYCVSHELVEMLTNRDGQGFFSQGAGYQCEIGDICENDASGNPIRVLYKGWVVEPYWSNCDQSCVAVRPPIQWLLQWSYVGNTIEFGHGINDGRPFWIGNFTGANKAEVLFYYPGDDNWWLGSIDPTQPIGSQWQWKLVGNTAGFGHGVNDGRPFWIGNFTGVNKAEVLFYYPGDDNWWLGSIDPTQPIGNELQWLLVGNTAGFGHGINDGRPFWIGNFTGVNKDEILFYTPGDDNWWLGSIFLNQLQWELVGNTVGFGHGINDGRPFWIGNFTGANKAEVLFYYPGDDNWWLGSIDQRRPPQSELQWELVGNTAGFGHGINDGRPFWIGNFTGANKAEMLFYTPRDDNWWLGSIIGNQLQWECIGNTIGFGHGINDGRPFWIGDFLGHGPSNVLFYYPGDDNWWLGAYDPNASLGTRLNWRLVGNTAGFGHGINDGRPFWIGNFTELNKDEVLFYYPGDDNWWLGNVSCT